MAGRAGEKADAGDLMRIREILAMGLERLRRAGVEEARVECEHMLMQILGVSRSELLYRSSEQSSALLTAEQEKQFFEWVNGREKRIPLAYLLGDAFFHSLKLKVGSGCLIPRPETERLVDEAANILRSQSVRKPVILDVGAGSGAIALALLAIMPEARAVMVDFSAEALKIARKNTAELGFLNRAEFILSDLFTAVSPEVKADLIVSNPPYLTEEDLKNLQPEVAYEPRMALDGGTDGLSFYRRIIPDAARFLKPRGWIGFEFGMGQAAAIGAELKRNGYEDLRIIKDHQDIERVIFGRCYI